MRSRTGCSSRSAESATGKEYATDLTSANIRDTEINRCGQDVVDRLLRDAKIDIVPVDADLAARAMSGWRRSGKGRHPAGLNFGGCFTYALAERTRAPRPMHGR
jgi:ribonuclease VapC